MLGTSFAGAYLGYNTLLPDGAQQGNTMWFDSRSNTSMVFTLAYFDADTNVKLRTKVVYTIVLVSSDTDLFEASNAFRLILAYNTTAPPTIPSSDTSDNLTTGAIAGIVIAAVAVAVLLIVVVVRLVRRSRSSFNWSSRPASEPLQWPTQAPV